MKKQEVVLTGDRPSGPLHLGHYVGSLLNRVTLQDLYPQYVMIADIQALTDNASHPEKVRNHVLEVFADYRAVGIDPQKTTFFIQSMIPEIAELTVLFLNLVTINRLKRNPTVKAEIAQKQFGESIPAGFLVYPVSQTADIAIVKGTLVPVGEDQLPVIEQANEILRSFNRIYNVDIFPEITPLVSQSAARLIGLDGKAKMSKSLNNAIFLKDDVDTLRKKVMSMYTDPHHIRVEDPGCVEGNVVFTYLDIFGSDKEKINEMKEHYTRGGLGDVTIKKYLFEELNALLAPIRERREHVMQDQDAMMKLLLEHTEKIRVIASETMREVKKAIKLWYAI